MPDSLAELHLLVQELRERLPAYRDRELRDRFLNRSIGDLELSAYTTAVLRRLLALPHVGQRTLVGLDFAK
jgi:hypothetical protein